ncbi:uncharacterized protein LOC144622838 isoform X2 [Crassostrea virginica]
MSAALPIIETTVKECLARLKSNPGQATQAISPHQEESTTSIPSTSAFNAIVDLEPSTGKFQHVQLQMVLSFKK